MLIRSVLAFCVKRCVGRHRPTTGGARHEPARVQPDGSPPHAARAIHRGRRERGRQRVHPAVLYVHVRRGPVWRVYDAKSLLASLIRE